MICVAIIIYHFYPATWLQYYGDGTTRAENMYLFIEPNNQKFVEEWEEIRKRGCWYDADDEMTKHGHQVSFLADSMESSQAPQVEIHLVLQ